MGKQLQEWWESRRPRTRVLVAIPVMFVVLFAFHQFFPKLSNGDRLVYALMECIPLALVVAWATENELRRRRDAERRDED